MENINGIDINIPIPSICNGYNGTLLILGGGKSVWADYLEAKKIAGGYRIMCVNDIGCQFKAEPIQHAVSLHKGILPAVRHMRKEKSMLEHVVTHCHKEGPEIQVVWPISNVGGTSGLFAVKIAVAMGYDKIIICGIPMDGSGHYFDPDNCNDNHSTKFDDKSSIRVWSHFLNSNIYAREHARSMSGRTAGILGKPTAEWIRSK